MPNILKNPIISGNLDVTGNSNTAGYANVAGNLIVGGDSNLAGKINLTGTTNISGNLKLYNLEQCEIYADIDMKNNIIKNVGPPTGLNDIVTKGYMDTYVEIAVGNLQKAVENNASLNVSDIDLNNNRLTNLTEIIFNTNEKFKGTIEIENNIKLLQTQVKNIQDKLDAVLSFFTIEPSVTPPSSLAKYTFTGAVILVKDTYSTINLPRSLEQIYKIELTYEELPEPTIFNITNEVTNKTVNIFGDTNSTTANVILLDGFETQNFKIKSINTDISINTIQFSYINVI